MRAEGYIEQVALVYAGSHLSADHAINDTVLSVEDAVDFSEEGGVLRLNDVDYEYVAVDTINNTVTLATGLVAPAVDFDEVRLVPESIEKVATVGQGTGDSLTAVVAHHLFGYLPDGIREPGQRENVGLEQIDGVWYVVNIIGRLPVFDASYLDPNTIPQQEFGSDGFAPDYSPSPTVAGGVGSLFIRWTPVANADAVTYEVHVSDTTGFLPTTATLVAETAGSTASIRTDANEVPLQYGVTYYVRLIAKDEDGSAAPSGEGSGSLVQVNAADIAAEYVYAGGINVGQLTGGELISDILLSGDIKTAEQGSRVEIGSGGITVYKADNTPTTVLGSDGNSTFKGQVVATGLTVEGGMSLRGTNNEVSQGASLRLASATTESTNAPAVVMDWASTPLKDNGGSNYNGALSGLQKTSDGKWLATDAIGNSARKFNADGTWSQSFQWPRQVNSAVEVGGIFYGVYRENNANYLMRLTESEHFNETFESLTNWTTYGNTVASNGRLRLTTSENAESAAFRSLSTGIKGKAVQARPFIPAAYGATQDVEMYVGGGGGAYMKFNNGRLNFGYLATGSTNISWQSTTYSAGSHAYWRIVESAGKVMFQTSPDGVSWTTHRTILHGWSDATMAGFNFHLRARDFEPENEVHNPSFETDLAGWSAGGVSGFNAPSLTRVTTYASEGSYSMRMSAGSAGNMAATMSEGVSNFCSVTAGKRYEVSADFRAYSTSRDVRVGVWWYSPTGSYIGSGGTFDATDHSTYWRNVSGLTAVAPSGATFARLYVAVYDAAANEMHYVDNVKVVEYESTTSIVAEFDDAKYLTPAVAVQLADNTSQVPALGVQGSNLLTSHQQSGGYRFTQYDPNTMAQLSQVETTYLGLGLPDVVGIAYGTFDFGAARYVAAMAGGGTNGVKVFSATGVEQTTEHFEAPSSSISGIAWDGSKFVSLAGNTLYDHTGIKWTTQSAAWKAGFAWFNSTSGQYSAVSPYANFTMKKRGRVTITAPTLPNTTDSIRVFMGYQSGSAYQQGTSAVNANSIVFTSVGSFTSGTIAPTVGTFTTSIPASLRSTNDELVVEANGDFKAKNANITGTLTVAGQPVGGGLPAGVVTQFAGATAPSGYLLCQGQALSTSTYASLFAAIGYTYGGSSGTFYLPDLRTRIVIGKGDTSYFNSLGLNDGRAEGNARGDSHSHSHKHTTPNTVDSAGSHSHNVTGTSGISRGENATLSGSGVRLYGPTDQHTHSLSNAGNHNHALPDTNSAVGLANQEASPHSYIVLNYIIKT